MKGKVVFGALLVSVALSGQVFGFELLDNLLGLNRGGCGPCQPAACEPAAIAACEPAYVVPAAAACDVGCVKPQCCPPRIRPVRDLFDGLECLARRHLCPPKAGCCPQVAACEPAAIACEPAAIACEPVAIACEPVAVCPPAAVACPPAAVACPPAAVACKPAAVACKPRCRPVLDFLEGLFGRRCCPKAKKACAQVACAAPAVWSDCGVLNGNGAPVRAPAVEEPAPLPPAPDPSASIIRPRQMQTANRALAQY